MTNQPSASETEPVVVPKFYEFIPDILSYLTDGVERSNKEIYTAVAERSALSPKQMKQLMSNGRRLVYVDRISWGLTYLKQWGAVDSPGRGRQKISDKGKKLANQYPQGLSSEIVAEIVRGVKSGSATVAPTQPSKSDTNKSDTKNDVFKVAPSTSEPANVDESTPQELIDESIAQLESALVHDVLERVRSISPSAFEQLVVDILLAMGYGGAEERGIVTQTSRDGGIDGVIDQDALGLSKIYVQAKRYGEKNTVGRPAIQEFVGAVHAEGTQGVFITSSSFTTDAREFAKKLSGSTSVVLVDGEHLARLMVKYGIGVQVERTYTIKRIDEDFFDEA